LRARKTGENPLRHEEETIDTHSKGAEDQSRSALYPGRSLRSARAGGVRWFFRVAARLDDREEHVGLRQKVVSDASMGTRSVMSPRERLQAMLDSEFDLDGERLAKERAITLVLRLCRYSGGAKLPWRP